MKPREHIVWEIVLILSSVLVFRSMWTLMDRMDILNQDTSLVLMMIAGLVLSVLAIYLLTHRD